MVTLQLLLEENAGGVQRAADEGLPVGRNAAALERVQARFVGPVLECCY